MENIRYFWIKVIFPSNGRDVWLTGFFKTDNGLYPTDENIQDHFTAVIIQLTSVIGKYAVIPIQVDELSKGDWESLKPEKDILDT